MFRPPILYLLPTALCLWLAARFGVFLRTRRLLQEDEQADFGVIQAATLTLLALIIGFSFSMTTSRYDLRKNYEDAEANAIGTEWVRAGLLSPGDTAKVRSLLRLYLDLRIAFCWTRNMLGQMQRWSALPSAS